ncbi:uncharacterized protein PHALS_14864 [Plasmopara halstedii]|uniref:Uncharacterized protein n=1 Tax=Plasmopara halstedii TaxID=4781 RepID=A0A0P1A799_PLAHL|nr:uncharacterized protein PHALS_14864 [Plasmopara halstedii]CEG36322.1 hypothetical protein PHALS_14864 [Plasmopara halstedii]|eukprot:XP_024572691.1 hypothetical protein PHALS_14864 [Plasmopara halstedii]
MRRTISSAFGKVVIMMRLYDRTSLERQNVSRNNIHQMMSSKSTKKNIYKLNQHIFAFLISRYRK